MTDFHISFQESLNGSYFVIQTFNPNFDVLICNNRHKVIAKLKFKEWKSQQ